MSVIIMSGIIMSVIMSPKGAYFNKGPPRGIRKN